MKKFFLFIVMSLLGSCVMAQSSVTLTFTCRSDSGVYVQPDYIIIKNLTQNWSDTIYFPDTVYTLDLTTGIGSYSNASITSQVVPNPFSGTSMVNLSLPEQGLVSVEVADMIGRIVASNKYRIQTPGLHQYRVTLHNPGTYIFKARQNGKTTSVKMLNQNDGGRDAVEYVGAISEASKGGAAEPKSTKFDSLNYTHVGDQMSYVGYIHRHASAEILQEINNSETLTLTFNSDGLPCNGAATVSDIDGNVYNTVQIGAQCWMNENLRVTRYADNTEIPVGGNGGYDTPYRYVPGNESNVAAYGYLYNWPAVMRGAASSGNGLQGVCPNGWYMPSNEDWLQLFNYVGGIDENVCNGDSSHIAKALAAAIGWENSGTPCAPGNDLFMNNVSGFAASPAGRYGDLFGSFGESAYFWSSTAHDDYYAKYVGMHYNREKVVNSQCDKTYGLSVRCLRGITAPTVITDTAFQITDTSAVCIGRVAADGGDSVTVRGVCWNTTPNPTTADNYMVDTTGVDIFQVVLTDMTPATTYYVRAFAANSVDTSYGNEVSFTTVAVSVGMDGRPCFGMPTVSDTDGNIYNTVRIGQQCWMKENLRTTKYADGTNILLGSSPSATTACRYYPNNDTSVVTAYGYLYNWRAVMRDSSANNTNPSGVQGICPTGWHVPSDAEWTQLTDYVSAQNVYTCGDDITNIAKVLAATTGWNVSDTACSVGEMLATNNATGFSALPAGNFFYGYNAFGGQAYFWSSTENDGLRVFTRSIFNSLANVGMPMITKDFALSVRCLHDGPVITDSVYQITDTCAVCCAHVSVVGEDTVTVRGVCWNTAPNPTMADYYTVDSTNTSAFQVLLTELTPATTYYVRAFVAGSVDTVYGNEIIFTTVDTVIQDGRPCSGMPTVSDVDGNIYNTVQIGNQCWMKENLKTTKYSDGTSIALGSEYSWSDPTPYLYYPNNDFSMVDYYGYLYNWKAVMRNTSSSDTNSSGVQGICPTGWHVPSNGEWTELTDYVSSQSQYVCGDSSIAKALADTTGWSTSTNACAVGNDQSANNATGFSARPTGDISGNQYNPCGFYARFWSSTNYDASNADYWFLDYGAADMIGNNINKNSGLSVRCLRD